MAAPSLLPIPCPHHLYLTPQLLLPGCGERALQQWPSSHQPQTGSTGDASRPPASPPQASLQQEGTDEQGRPGQDTSGPPHPPGLTFFEQLLLAAVQGAYLLGHLLWPLSR